MRLQTSFSTVLKPASLEQSAHSQAVKISTRLSQFPTLLLLNTSEPMIELNITSGKFDCRVKDNKFVYCAMEEVMEPMLARARSRYHHCYHQGDLRMDELVIIQRNRPSSLFWNSRMVCRHKLLALKYQVTIRRFSEQISHTKVCVSCFISKFSK